MIHCSQVLALCLTCDSNKPSAHAITHKFMLHANLLRHPSQVARLTSAHRRVILLQCSNVTLPVPSLPLPTTMQIGCAAQCVEPAQR